jgi:hypothetical protein
MLTPLEAWGLFGWPTVVALVAGGLRQVGGRVVITGSDILLGSSTIAFLLCSRLGGSGISCVLFLVGFVWLGLFWWCIVVESKNGAGRRGSQKRRRIFFLPTLMLAFFSAGLSATFVFSSISKQ